MTTIHFKTNLPPSRPASPCFAPVSEAEFIDRVVRMGVVNHPATTAAAMQALLQQGICANGVRQWLAQELEPGEARDQLLAAVYALASLAQLVVGRLLDKFPVKPLFFAVLFLQIVMFGIASQTSGWAWYVAAIGYMVMVFGSIPFGDTMVVRYIDDSMRSRVSGTRIAISFGISSLAVYLLGPVVKHAGFTQLMMGLTVVAAIGALMVLFLPGESQMKAHAMPVPNS